MFKQLSLLTLTLITTNSYAATLQYQPFADFGLGQATAKDICDGTAELSINCDEKDTFFRIGGGVLFSDNISAEMSYLNFGRAKFAGSSNNLIPGFATVGDITTSAIALQVGMYGPLSPQLYVYGKVGPAFTQTKLTAQVGSYTRRVGLDETDSQVEALFTLGAGYQFTSAFSANFQLDYIPNVGNEDENNEPYDIQTFSLGLKYKF